MLFRDLIAFDRASARRKDVDGHLHVDMTNISKANVREYCGREIPEFATLGLDPARTYRMYCPPDELAAAAPTFAGIHKAVTADMPATDDVVGSVGTDVNFAGEYLRAPLSIWRADAIAKIESGEQRELSPAYRYTADMTPGQTPLGLTYDGVMRNMMGNHVAIVRKGRTGPDVVVADEFPKVRTMKFAKLLAALRAAIPSLTDESAVALDAALTAEVGEPVKPVVMDAAAVIAAHEATPEFKAKYVLATDSATAVAAETAKLAPAVEAARAAARAEALADSNALHAARAAVASKVGACALDSAEAVYRFALDKVGVAHKDIPATALSALYEASTKAVTSDAATAKPFSITELIPGLSLIRKG